MAVRVLLVLAALTLLYGCGQEGSPAVEKEKKRGSVGQAAGEKSKTRDGTGSSAVLKLYPTNPPDPSGSASFTEADGDVRVKLNFRGLPKPHKTYLSHIHSGYCGTGGGHADHGQVGEAADDQRGADHKQGDPAREHGEERGGAHEEHGRERGAPRNIEYPLTPVESDAEGRGSSTTMLKDLTIHELYTGEAKYINLHTGGTGNPPDLACANIIKLD